MNKGKILYRENDTLTTVNGEQFRINHRIGKNTFNITFLDTGRTVNTGKLGKVIKGCYVSDPNNAYRKHEVGDLFYTEKGYEFELLEVITVQKEKRKRTKYRVVFTETGRIVTAGDISCLKLDHYTPYK